MKKILAVVVVLAMVSGCAGFGVWSPGAQKVVDFMCNPTTEQMAEATKWLAALDSIQAGVSIAFPPIAIVKASTAMTVLKNGGCFLLSEIQAALDLLGNMQERQIMGTKAVMIPIKDQFPALWAAVNKGKK